MSRPELSVAVVGLGFGSDFAPIYDQHPDVGRVIMVEPDTDRRLAVAARLGLEPGYPSLDEAVDHVDAVHLLTPVSTHAELSRRCLDSGKHVACAVPMATTLDDLTMIIEAQRRSGGVYMMMETSVFGREYAAVAAMRAAGELGDLTLYRGVHIQNLDGFPAYWQGFPPMHYLTHALSPILRLLDTTVSSVTCRGAGRLAPARTTGGYDNPYPTEVGLFSLHGSDLLAEVTMAFSQTGRPYVEGFSLYGDRGGVEWTPSDDGRNDGPLRTFAMTGPAAGSRGNQVTAHSYEPPDTTAHLPAPIRRFGAVGTGHGGSHPHLVHEFVRSIVEGRAPLIDAARAAAWTAPGICAHRSALAGGVATEVPVFPGPDSVRTPPR